MHLHSFVRSQKTEEEKSQVNTIITFTHK